MSTRSFIAVMLALLGLGLLGLWSWDSSREHRLLIAAGQRSGQAFQIAKALQQVTERHYQELKLEVFETRGALHNASLLDQGAVQLATVQADQASGRKARLVAELYPDTFQIVVRRDSGIDTIGDLVGKRIALPPERSGEYESFWFLAKHYALTPDDLKLYTGTERTTDWLLINGDVDALFRVRAPGDASILNLIQRVNGKVIPIPQAAALRLQHPAFEAGVIPQGSYNGRPAIPERDEPTISVKELLVASEDVPAEVIAKITSVLFRAPPGIDGSRSSRRRHRRTRPQRRSLSAHPCRRVGILGPRQAVLHSAERRSDRAHDLDRRRGHLALPAMGLAAAEAGDGRL